MNDAALRIAKKLQLTADSIFCLDLPLVGAIDVLKDLHVVLADLVDQRFGVSAEERDVRGPQIELCADRSRDSGKGKCFPCADLQVPLPVAAGSACEDTEDGIVPSRIRWREESRVDGVLCVQAHDGIGDNQVLRGP